MNVGEFLKALIDDITGKDANGRNADQKRAYMYWLMALLAVATVGLAFTVPIAALVTGAILVWKIKIHLTNTY